MVRSRAALLLCVCAALLCACAAPIDAVELPQGTVLPDETQVQSVTDADRTAAPESAETTEETQSPEPTPTPVNDDGKHLARIGVYLKDDSGKRLIRTQYKGKWTKGKDIACFEVLPTQEETIRTGRFSALWQSYAGELEDIGEYRLGYEVTLTYTNGDVTTRRIKEPEDTMVFKEWLETYLYDDIHQTQGVRYSHLVRADMHEDTIVTSIKLTCAAKIDEVAHIKLSVFAYRSEADFDAEGRYTGSIRFDTEIDRD